MNGRDYHDYVIKDGVFIGKFEEMYQKFDDPWHQIENMHLYYDKLVTPPPQLRDSILTV